MTTAPPSPDLLSEIARDVAASWSVETAAVAGVLREVLQSMGEARSSAVPHALIEARREALKLGPAAGTVAGVRPLDVLRRGPDDARESAVVSVLAARDFAGGSFPASARDHLAALDWLEFTGPYAPLAALAIVCEPSSRAAWHALLADTLPGPSSPRRAMLAALRGVALAPPPAAIFTATPVGVLTDGARTSRPPPNVTVEGELGPAPHGPVLGALALFTGVAFVRGASRLFARAALSARAPAVLTLDGARIHLTAHREMLGRVTRTIESRHAVADLAAIEQSTRFGSLPIALTAATLLAGTILGARAAIEGAGAVYFPLVALGLGLVLGGVVCEWLVRAVWPAARGRTRVVIRPRNGAPFELDAVDPAALAKLFDALDATAPRGPSRP